MFYSYPSSLDYDSFRAGFQIEFSNNYMVSVQFGTINYCDNRDAKTIKNKYRASCENAEVAVLKYGEFIDGWPNCPQGDEVRGWVTPEELIEILAWAKSQSEQVYE
jgi:hypothetical protein